MSIPVPRPYLIDSFYWFKNTIFTISHHNCASISTTFSHKIYHIRNHYFWCENVLEIFGHLFVNVLGKLSKMKASLASFISNTHNGWLKNMNSNLMIDDNVDLWKKNWRFCKSVIIRIRFTELFSKNNPNGMNLSTDLDSKSFLCPNTFPLRF